MGDVFPILPSTTLDLGQFFISELLARGEIPGINLCVNLHARVLGDHVCHNSLVSDGSCCCTQLTVWYGNPLEDRNSLPHYRVMLHVRHGKHTINLLDAEPVENVRHEGLEAHLIQCETF